MVSIGQNIGFKGGDRNWNAHYEYGAPGSTCSTGGLGSTISQHHVLNTGHDSLNQFGCGNDIVEDHICTDIFRQLQLSGVLRNQKDIDKNRSNKCKNTPEYFNISNYFTVINIFLK